MTFVEQALALFENGVPTLADFKAEVWTPSHSEYLGDDKKVLTAIYHYIDAYHALERGHINTSYNSLLSWRSNYKDVLPKSLDIEALIGKHDEIVKKNEAKRAMLVKSRKPLLDAALEKLRDALSEVNRELDDTNMELYIDSQYSTISIEDRTTGESVDLDLDDLDE